MKEFYILKMPYICANYFNKLNSMWKAFFGALVALCLFLLFLYLFDKPVVSRYFSDLEIAKIKSEITKVSIADTNKSLLTEVKSQLANNEEKLSSINKRFDDLYILAGIIVTLLLAINVGIFVNTDSKIDKYFTEHYEETTKKVKKYEIQIEALFSEYKALVELYKQRVEASLKYEKENVVVVSDSKEGKQE
jgi:uncharacterized integral membrane protein